MPKRIGGLIRWATVAWQKAVRLRSLPTTSCAWYAFSTLRTPKQTMNIPKSFPINPLVSSLATSYWQWRKLWIFTTIGFLGLGLAYAVLLKKDMWVASQALIVRDEATGAVMRLGRFESQTQMKVAQETVLEIARNSQVVEAALKEVGRPAKFFGLMQNNDPPTKSEVEDFAKSCVSVRAPRGAELGTTEMIYLDVKQDSKERAVKLTMAICDALELQLKSVRIERAGGVIQELEAAKSVCEESLQLATEELRKMEVDAGSDLADLRGLSESAVGSTNRFMLDMVRDELRKADLSIKTMTPNVQFAQAAMDNPSLILQAADALTASNPVILKLREGLSEAMVRTSNLEGKFTASHPEVVNARKAETSFRDNIRSELQRIIQGYEAAIGITQQKMQALDQQERELGQRLNRLAELRPKYSNLVAEVKSRSDKLSQIKNELTETMAARDAAGASSLLTRLDNPVLGEKPIGPGRTTIVGGAAVGGLMFGLGVVFLLIPLDTRLTNNNENDNYQNNERNFSANEAQASVERQTVKQGPTRTSAIRPTRASENSQSKKANAPLTEVASNSGSDPTQAALSVLPSAPTNNDTKSGSGKAETRSSEQDFSTDPLRAVELALAEANNKAKTNNSATAAAKSLQPEQAESTAAPIKPRRADSIDDVRNLISNALKTHTLGEDS